jgi:pimeloyl-ACP methyl ester carboxylesterase
MERAKAWPVVSETKIIETPSGQTFIRLSERLTDPPLILLPGSTGTSLTWIPNTAALSAHYRTYALDSIYDFGLSVRHGNIKRLEDLVTWLDEVLTVLVPEGLLSLVGLSYGGWLASQYALRFPERLHKIVLLASAVTVLPVSFALICRALLTLIPLSGFRQQFYDWLLHDTVQSAEKAALSSLKRWRNVVLGLCPRLLQPCWTIRYYRALGFLAYFWSESMKKSTRLERPSSDLIVSHPGSKLSLFLGLDTTYGSSRLILSQERY